MSPLFRLGDLSPRQSRVERDGENSPHSPEVPLRAVARGWNGVLVVAYLLRAMVAVVLTPTISAGILDKQKLLETETFWDNRDWDWYKANIPFFECPDADITTTYYYRWELVTKHLTYGSPASGYTFTEFIDRPFWSGAYGAISCPAGHQLYEVRWMLDPTIARDFARYWFRTPGAQPRNYSTWLADSVWALHEVHPDDAFTKDLLPDLIKNFEGWEKRHWVPDVGMFWQTGHDDGMEYNINSRQTKDIVRGAPGYRPTLNAYMWADALAIARVADLAGDTAIAESYRAKAGGIKEKLQKMLWDPNRQFFFHMFKDDEQDNEGNVVKALTLTYGSGKFAGNRHGRELIGYVPWQFNLPDPGYESAWKFLMDPKYFHAQFGPTTVENRDPLFYLSRTCCWWSGISWPYATTQTLKALANLLHNYQQQFVTKDDYVKLLKTYARTHRKDGRPYIAEAAHPDTGSWEGHDSYNHSEHYFHSGFNDLIITGLVGVRPRADDVIEIQPLAPETWSYFALDDLPYHGRRITVLWDKDGTRYGHGAGLHLLADGNKLASLNHLGKISAKLPPASAQPKTARRKMNYAVNNEGYRLPAMTASYSDPRSPASFANDGNYWYHVHPPNRWTTAGSSNATDWIQLDLGVKRCIDTVKLYFVDDGTNIVAPASYTLEHWTGSEWTSLRDQKRSPDVPAGRRANVIGFAAVETERLRAVFSHSSNGRTGLSEFEAWGHAVAPYSPPPLPNGNLALNLTGEGFPKAAASFSDRYGGKPERAIDGKIVFRPSPMNRWTAYGSPNPTDWLEVDFGSAKTVGRMDLHIYDDRGGVQAPADYTIQFWADDGWKDASDVTRTPRTPAGSTINTAAFAPVSTSKIRVVFTHKGNAPDRGRSGVTEIEIWEK